MGLGKARACDLRAQHAGRDAACRKGAVCV
jgi:hypothetical protein